MLAVENLIKSYGTKKILDGVNLYVKKGEVLGFVGGNGAGKTTTLHSITGILEADKGRISINSIPKSELVAYKKQFYFIPDTIHIFKNISGYDWIQFVMKLYNIKQNDRLEGLVKQFTMTEAIHRPMGSYSYGMLHKTMLIAAFTISPPIIIMDEPLNGLDPHSVLTFKKQIKLYKDEGGTVLFSTHLLDIAEKICSTVAILKEGKIILHDDIDNVIGNDTLESIFMEKQTYVE